MKKRHLLIFALPLLFFFPFQQSQAQMYLENGRQVCCGDSILNGSYLSLGINPAHLGRVLSVKKGTGFLQVGGSFYSDGLDFSQVLGLSLTDNLLDSTTKQRIIDRNPPAENFEYDGKLEINWLSFSYAHPKYGGFALQIQDRFLSTAAIPNQFLGIALLGSSAPIFQDSTSTFEDVLNSANGTRLSYGHFRTIRFGYGVKLLDLDVVRLYGGFTYSRLFGIGYLNASIDNQAFSATSSFSELYQLDYQNINIQDPNYQRQLISNAGTGNAFSFGLSLDIGEKANISASIIDVGSLTFTENVSQHSASTQSILDSLQNGIIDSYNAGEASLNLFNLVDNQYGGEVNVLMNTQARVGGSYKINDNFFANAEAIIPMNSNNLSVIDVESATVIGAVTWNPIPKVFYLTGGTYYNPQFGWRIPFGASIGLGPKARISISTGDLATFLGASDPMASLTISILGHNY